jgi:hypothetical protein
MGHLTENSFLNKIKTISSSYYIYLYRYSSKFVIDEFGNKDYWISILDAKELLMGSLFHIWILMDLLEIVCPNISFIKGTKIINYIRTSDKNKNRVSLKVLYDILCEENVI